MKKLFLFVLCFLIPVIVVACDKKVEKRDIELMGAGDRIHDSFTFANLGVVLKEVEDNVFDVSGSVEKLVDENVKKEFDIDDEVTHVVSIKISANGKDVNEDKVTIKVDGVRSYDAEHLNGRDYTFVILEAQKNKNVSIEVSWNGEDKNTYVIRFNENLELK